MFIQVYLPVDLGRSCCSFIRCSEKEINTEEAKERERERYCWDLLTLLVAKDRKAGRKLFDGANLLQS